MQRKKVTPGYSLLLFIYGIIIGTGAILPGISGGVLCVAFGLYGPMVELFAHPVPAVGRYYKLLLPVFMGCGAGFLLLARAVEYLLTVASVSMTALFAGLICGTFPSLIRKSGDSGERTGWIGFVISLVLSYLLFSTLDASGAKAIQPSWGWFLFCGAVWAFSMLLPGLSSSSILMVMGLYQPMAEGIGHLDFSVLLPLLLGFLVTLLLCAKAIDRLIKSYYTLTSRFLLGFVISSTLTILPTSFASVQQAILAILCLAVGFCISYGMQRLSPH